MLFKKIQIISIVIAYLFLLNFDITESACANKLTCLHLGQWSETTCACACLPGYSGASCEFGNCNVQPNDCINISTDLCNNPLILNYCPKKCGAPICNCGYDTCLNEGTFNPNSCSCTCLPPFSGIRCNTTISATTSVTTISPTTPVTTISPTTPVTTISPTTPITSPPPTKPVTSLPITNKPIKCYYGFIFDLSTSKCKCDDGFYGVDCMSFNCSSQVEDDPDICPGSSCDLADEIKRFCPNKCFCPKGPTCLPCYNNGILDKNTCKCSCSADFTGEFCQYSKKPCEFENPIECLSIDCWNTSETNFYKCQKKCLCCGNIRCDPIGTTNIKVDLDKQKCTCQCLNDNYDDTKKCEIKKPCALVDPPYCSTQFKKTDCVDRFIKSTCPILCEACQAPTSSS